MMCLDDLPGGGPLRQEYKPVHCTTGSMDHPFICIEVDRVVAWAPLVLGVFLVVGLILFNSRRSK